MNFERKRRSKAISLVPMIDVLLCLLIFFMLSTQFIHWGSIQLITEKNEKSMTQSVLNPKVKKEIYLNLINNHAVKFENSTIELKEINKTLKNKYKNLNDLIVEVDVLNHVNLQAAIDLVMNLKSIGLKNIKLKNFSESDKKDSRNEKNV